MGADVNPIGQATDNEHLGALLPKVADQWNEYTRRLDGLADVHTRFKVQLERMTTNARSSSEATALIADRVAKAVDYFAAQYEEAAENMLPMLDIEIDNKEHAKEHQELAGQFESIVGLKNACLSHVKAEGFTVQDYQKAKYDYLLGNAETAKSKEKNKKKKQERKTAVATNYNVRYPELLSRLIIWRRNKYEELGVPAYVVMSQKSLLGIADRLPCTPEELSHISGIGKNRLKMFGEELLVLVRQFREDSGI